MKRLLCFSHRNFREILRDPLSIFFAGLFPVILLLLLTVLERSLPDMAQTTFALPLLAPAMNVFSLSFLTLFSAMLLSRDRNSAFLLRLYATPLRTYEFLLGYTLPLLPIALLQQLVCFAFAAVLGLPLGSNTLLCIAASLPIVLVNLALGLLCGSLLSEKSVGGVCGALLTNVTAWLSGAWFDLDLIGGVFAKIGHALPFYHAVEAARACISGNTAGLFDHLWPSMAWAAGLFLLAVFAFARQRRT